jgi:eukaryotic-like serine/threonine-protein kinase
VLAGGGWLAVREITASHRPSGARPAVAAQALTPVSATAFGPLGESDGDNPELARLAIDASPATAWHTQWYATAAFGNLKPGTGLLLDMGRPGTCSSGSPSCRRTPSGTFEAIVYDVRLHGTP